jgi:hypothetical protein
MIEITIADIVEKRIRNVPNHRVYLVHDGEFSFYVGKSNRNVIARLREHINPSRPTILGQLIIANEPQSLLWQVKLFTLADCEPYIRQKLLFPVEDGGHYTVSMAEKDMIAVMGTIVNKDFNQKPAQLPKSYRGHSILREPNIAYELEFNEANWLRNMILSGWLGIEDHDAPGITWQHMTEYSLTDDEIQVYKELGETPPLP